MNWSTAANWLRVEVRRVSGGINTAEPDAMVAMANPIFLGDS